MIALLLGCQGPWAAHVIDDGSRGADGARLADIDGDGRPDVVTPWEEGGVVRVALHPGAAVRERWPVREIERVPSPEDAVPVDLDGDGRIDVVTAAEGDARALVVRFADGAGGALPAADGTWWLQVTPLRVGGRLDLVAGGRGEIARFTASDPRDLGSWVRWPLRETGWAMSVVARDMDGDGDDDVLATDRYGRSGAFWLEQPADPEDPWPEHAIAVGGEAMFLAVGDLDGGGDDIVIAIAPRTLLLVRHDGRRRTIALPWTMGTAKAVAIGDIDGDGAPDLVATTEHAAFRVGVAWLRADGDPFADPWTIHPIARDGTKYDPPVLVDLDGDGDLDVLTTDEKRGVVWYENQVAITSR